MYADAAFVLNEVLPAHTVRGRLGDAFCEDREIREGRLVSERLVEAVLYAEKPLLNASPLLFFFVLVTWFRNELSSGSSTIEVSDRHVAAVFDIGETRQLLAKPQVFDYLILLIVSFVYVRVITLTVADGRGFRRPLKIDPLDHDSVIHAEWVDSGSHFYRLASLHQTAQEQQADSVLSELERNFKLAAKPVNVLSNHYLWQIGGSPFFS